MVDKVTAAEESQWRNLETQSGRSRADWIKLANAQGFAKHGELVAWLKSTQGIGHGYANLVAVRAREAAQGAPAAGSDEQVDAQYAGAKAVLRPLYEQLIATVKAFGADVEIAPKKTYVSLRRSKQFGLIQPSTADRLDVGLNLKGVEQKGRLEASGSFNAMVSHRVRLGKGDKIDADLKKWLRQAYDAA
jgi:predicted transport protein